MLRGRMNPKCHGVAGAVGNEGAKAQAFSETACVSESGAPEAALGRLPC